MHAAALYYLASQWQDQLAEAVVQNVHWFRCGLIVELTTSKDSAAPGSPTDSDDSTSIELGFFSFPGKSWAYRLQARQRQRIVDDLQQMQSVLLSPLPADLPWKDGKALCLDVLRAWLLAPVSAPRSWSQLIGKRWQGCQVTPGDRVLDMRFGDDNANADAAWTLRAELLERSANFFLLDPKQQVVARWRDREPLATRANTETDAAAEAIVVWDQEHQHLSFVPADRESQRHEIHTYAAALEDLQQLAARTLLQEQRQSLKRNTSTLR